MPATMAPRPVALNHERAEADPKRHFDWANGVILIQFVEQPDQYSESRKFFEFILSLPNTGSSLDLSAHLAI